MARLDMGWHEHPKILALSMAGMAVHAWSISYCDATRSDGLIPDGAWPSKKGFESGVKDVVAAGLWEPCEGGFLLHDYADYNRTKAQIETEQATTTERVRRWRNGVGNAVTADPKVERRNGVTLARAPAPVPVPETKSPVDLLKNGSTSASGAGAGNGADGAPPRALPPSAEQGQDEDTPNYDTPVPDNLGIVHAEAGVCPLCRLVYTGEYLDHTAEAHALKHDVAPGNLGGHFRRRRPGMIGAESPPEAPPPEFEAHVSAAHERLQAIPEAHA